MGNWRFLYFITIVCFLVLFLLQTCTSSVQNVGILKPGFRGSQIYWVDNNGLFLLSNNSNFAFGLTTAGENVTLFLLVVMHKSSSTIVWTANRGFPVHNADNFVFDETGNAYLQSGGSTVWSTDTANRGVSSMELLNSGNLVMFGDDGSVIWQSFSHPANTLLSDQEFYEGMKLTSDSGSKASNNLTYALEIKSGDMIVRTNFAFLPAACDPYSVCYPGNKCQCPLALSSCKSVNFHSCEGSPGPVELVDGGDGLSYFALRFVQPFSKTTLNGCKDSCLKNCSCSAMFFESSSGNCFMFNEIGSMQGSTNGANYTSYIKIFTSAEAKSRGHTGNKRITFIIIFVIVSFIIMIGLLFTRLYFCQKKKKVPETPTGSIEEDIFLEGLSGMPIRFSYKDLQTATNDFSIKLGQGGFGSVYKGTLPDGTQLAVKKLEGIGQGKKEFRAEVSIIGSIHHLHLVRLKGFCVQGLAYLHEDCDVKIVHCDIKPENVLLDDHFMAKVSDFGLAKLMTREQSHVFTTLRGTRGYLAPEWITNYAISEKSDVYSYGMVLLELIGGRKNYNPAESSDKSHFPSYAFKMMEEGNMKEIVDAILKIDEDDERVGIAIKVALWCIQDDVNLRPPMTKVVQMLEGLSPVPLPPTGWTLGSRISLSEGGTSLGPSNWNSDAYLSAVRLSGPR
ncbi:Serine/threonine protein kinase [Handroanthus impetiginosus]|uniref:non-specific serine/threonine protein kinase n=1 Tax=Handroanthus impetiginosus TaxID=429701 RepID=A0A2G9GX58_9LAMI|nr:Serine/threonine protein kinase [Handroanthus impetiginosus]